MTHSSLTVNIETSIPVEEMTLEHLCVLRDELDNFMYRLATIIINK